MSEREALVAELQYMADGCFPNSGNRRTLEKAIAALTAPDKPTIDEQILQNQLAEADRRASGRPRVATYELLNGYTYVTKTAYDNLLDYADRMAAERDGWKTLSPCELMAGNAALMEYGKHWEGRAETAERLLAELQAKHDALVKRLREPTDEMLDAGREAGDFHILHYDGIDKPGTPRYSLRKSWDAMTAVALDKGGE